LISFKPGAVLLEDFQVLRAEAAARVQVFKTAALDEKTRDIDHCFAFDFYFIKIKGKRKRNNFEYKRDLV
jgi:hypothetical protein